MHYLSLTLQTLTLDDERFEEYRRMLECFARLVAGEGDARALGLEAAALGAGIEEARFIDRMWSAARSMIDERTTGTWYSPQLSDDLRRLGSNRPPDQVLVGLIAGQSERLDSVEALLARDAFQRACVELVRRYSNVVCGRVADHGITLLASQSDKRARSEAELVRLAQRVSELAHRDFGLRLHVGISSGSRLASLGQRYEQALGAAERALLAGRSRIRADDEPRPSRFLLRQLRRDLGATSEQHPNTLAPRFERYIEAVAIDCGHRLELARAELEAGFDQAAHALLGTGALDERSYRDMCEMLDAAAREAATVNDLFSAFRRAIVQLKDAAERPVSAAQGRSLGRALGFVRRHFAEPLNLAQVARVAGFAPRYFSVLLKRREGTTFERYLKQIRIQHSQKLLTGTDLSVERVGQLSGFRLRPHFHRAFKQLVGKSPAEYRRASVSGKSVRVSPIG